MSGAVKREEPVKPLWWESTEAYWDLPFYADAGLNCEAQLNRDDELAGREQLWAIREADDEIQPFADEYAEAAPEVVPPFDVPVVSETTGGTE